MVISVIPLGNTKHFHMLFLYVLKVKEFYLTLVWLWLCNCADVWFQKLVKSN